MAKKQGVSSTYNLSPETLRLLREKSTQTGFSVARLIESIVSRRYQDMHQNRSE